MHWDRYNFSKIKAIIGEALGKNMDFHLGDISGYPSTHLDKEIFYEDAPFLEDAPYLRTLIENPNHIGVHTFTQSETAWKGTQQIEREVISICAEQIFHGKPDQHDGYVSPGGTESNIQALWVYRNYFINEFNANTSEIAVLYSADTHYSIPKGINMLNLSSVIIPVDENSRLMKETELSHNIITAKNNGFKYFIVVLNVGTTMFGSVDDVGVVIQMLDKEKVIYKIHVDAAFGGFVYQFSNPDSEYTFQNEKIDSITIDAHKMLGAPYGTGIFLIRKGFIHHVLTREAAYVHGQDYTICGSRSGAHAIAIWMILRTYGSEGWKFKIERILDKTTRVCEQLNRSGYKYYRNPFMNIITFAADPAIEKVAKKYTLVPDSHIQPKWYKAIVMDHVTQGHLDKFIGDLKSEKSVTAVS